MRLLRLKIHLHLEAMKEVIEIFFLKNLHQKILASVINAFSIEKESVGAFLAAIEEMPVEEQQEKFLTAILGEWHSAPGNNRQRLLVDVVNQDLEAFVGK